MPDTNASTGRSDLFIGTPEARKKEPETSSNTLNRPRAVFFSYLHFKNPHAGCPRDVASAASRLSHPREATYHHPHVVPGAGVIGSHRLNVSDTFLPLAVPERDRLAVGDHTSGPGWPCYG